MEVSFQNSFFFGNEKTNKPTKNGWIINKNLLKTQIGNY